MRHRVRLTKGKTGIKHGSTLVDNTGQGVGSVFSHKIYVTKVGTRNASGAAETIRNSQTTDEVVNVGDIIKYVNICLQCSPRGAEPTNPLDNAGWLEWAIFWQREKDVDPTVANLGTETLGVVCGRAFRENTLLTGCFPLGTNQANSVDIKIKLPARCCKIKIGDVLRIACHVRTSSSTDVRTDSHRLIASSMFKNYVN